LKKQIDINCDLGESFGVYRYGADQQVMPLISSANVACGFHAGDPHVIRETIELAAAHNVLIGAHIGFPDKLGFGRREINAAPQEVYDYIIYQLGALDGFMKIAGLTMSHIKLHGALYMMACEKQEISKAAVKAVCDYNPDLEIYTLPNSEMSKNAAASGLRVVHEFFADRPYDHHGVRMFNWSLKEIGCPKEAAKRVLTALEQSVYSEYSTNEHIHSICVHSDTPGAPEIIREVREALIAAGWAIGNSQQVNV